MSDTTLWTCGVLGKTHGLRGELYLKPAPRGLEYMALGERFYVTAEGRTEGAERLIPCTVTRAGGTDRRPLVRLDIAASRDEARAVQGAELLAAGGALDELPHYRVGDLVGRPVRTASGRPLGEVADVLEAPAHEILDVRTPAGESLLVPLVEQLVRLDEKSGALHVVDGLLERPDDVEA